ncbi:DUF1638 domain-containing protein [Geotalea sp. SG265]|uniref:DUF1638 domain-containing protein n=1 Tax=Geotalea sp. SG265 TaxID=2922867 RepID=UPI001FAF8B3C|nr:DUF1638 domain-containing protein [Geotalea sp. SG265]
MAVTRIIACQVMEEELLAIPTGQPVDFHFVSTGLHRWPEKLREELQRLVGESSDIERVVLAFGLCGGAVAGLKAPVPLSVPLAHDCIPLLLGSSYTHESLIAEEKGTFFLSSGWLEGERNIFSEYRRVLEKYGEQKARRVMGTMFDAYTRLLFIRTGHPREDEHQVTAEELAGLIGLRFSRMNGRQAWLQRIVNGPWDGDGFLCLGPDQPIREADFA